MTTTKATLTTTTTLGTTGPQVPGIGLGCMGMSGWYGPPDEAEGIATIQHALERGVTLLDTGDFYGMGHNEMLIGKAIAGRRDRAVLSVKFGLLRSPDGAMLGYDARPAAVKTWCSYSLKRLGVDVIDVYRPSRLDPSVPIEDTIGAIADLVKAGYVRHIGLSEVSAETVRRAAAVAPIVDLQIEYSVASRKPERAIFPTLRELGVSSTMYGVFSRGLLTGSKPAGPGDIRNGLPRFQGENAAKNATVAQSVQAFARARGLSTGQLLIAWSRAKQPGFVPVIGARTRAQLDDAIGALDHTLSPADVDALEALVPDGGVAGDRYGAMQMAHLDSER